MTTLYLRSTALTCAALCLGLSLSVASASAKDVSSPSVRLAQQRLIDLGYYAGNDDGAMGFATRDAIRDFQARNGLEVSGVLTPVTAQLLKDQDYAAMRGYGYGVAPSYAYGYGYNGYYANLYAPSAYYGNVAYNNNGYYANRYTPTAYYGTVAYNTDAPVAYYR